MNPKRNMLSMLRLLLAMTLLVGLLHAASSPALAATQIDIIGPPGSVHFGKSVTVLPNGNIVVTDPEYDGGIAVNAGAVYLYDGATGAQISMLTGMSANDYIGSGGVTVLSNGNYVVSSPYCDNGAAADAGAVTWGNGDTGVSGVVSAANSLVGSTAGDQVGYNGVTALSNANYLVSSPKWDNGAAADAGAVTWGYGTSGVSGAVSAANSLVGSTAGDQVGVARVSVLSNGNYLVSIPSWDNGIATDAGAVTWGNGASGVSGAVSAANSLVGSTAGDLVGGVTALSNGNYVVSSPDWDNGAAADAGAVTWGNGGTGVSGAVSAANSLVGSTTGDRVGSGGVPLLSNSNYVVKSPYWDNGAAATAGPVIWGNGATGVSGAVSVLNGLAGSTPYDNMSEQGVTELSNGNYLVRSFFWDNGAVADAGAVTWGNGMTGIVGLISAANSLVGSTAGDHVGASGVAALSNGNYVVSSSRWSNGAVAGAGAVTWGNGATGISGPVSSANSLVGSTANDWIGDHVTALSNGNYVVGSSYWDNGTAANAGAVTWGSGATGISGPVSTANSLVGSKTGDRVGDRDIFALSNGNYVVSSRSWTNGTATDAGAVTWGNGATGTSGAVSSANSLVGLQTGDQVGDFVIALSNGNYVVGSPYWDNSTTVDAGAVTWASGVVGRIGAISASNSLIGSTPDDQVGSGEVIVLSNSNYVVLSPIWDYGTVVDAGAVTWGNGISGIFGVISSANSLVGSTADDLVGNDVTALSNGNYLVSSPDWDNGTVADAGAVTWGNGATGISGAVSTANSLVGSTATDWIGHYVTALSNGNYLVRTPVWDNGVAVNAGAVTWGFGASGISGPVTTNNSVLGEAAGGGYSMVFQYDSVNRQLVVGRPADNIVTLFRLPYIFLPVVRK